MYNCTYIYIYISTLLVFPALHSPFAQKKRIDLPSGVIKTYFAGTSDLVRCFCPGKLNQHLVRGCSMKSNLHIFQEFSSKMLPHSWRDEFCNFTFEFMMVTIVDISHTVQLYFDSTVRLIVRPSVSTFHDDIQRDHLTSFVYAPGRRAWAFCQDVKSEAT